MAGNPLQIWETLDPDFLKLIGNSRDFALADGALPRKFKLLMAMAFDAAHGTVDGVRALAQAAMQAGATKEEITEALRVAQYFNGVGCVYTAAEAFEGLFESS